MKERAENHGVVFLIIKGVKDSGERADWWNIYGVSSAGGEKMAPQQATGQNKGIRTGRFLF